MSDSTRNILIAVAVGLLVLAIAFWFFGGSSCPEKGCRDYGGLSIARIQPVNDGEALAVAAAQLATAEDRHAKAIAVETAKARAEADRDKAAFLLRFMEKQQEAAEQSARRADEAIAISAGGLAGRRRGIPCGQDRFLPCR
ncbi:MAG: hypothetical protein QY311_02260 [Candidatus Paceibacterota bacterium]|nr:MAG: hypothetical protein QY311_02260 [Candidatus Paceibacterota bacterium]